MLEPGDQCLKKCSIFANSSYADVILYGGWVGIKYGKAFTLRFVLDTLKSSKFLSRQRQGNGRCPLGMILSHVFCAMQKLCCVFISAWASALLVSTGWAMLEPQSVGRVTSQTPTLFYYKPTILSGV